LVYDRHSARNAIAWPIPQDARGGENVTAALARHPPIAAAAACSTFLVLCKLVNTLALGLLVDIGAAELLAADRVTLAP